MHPESKVINKMVKFIILRVKQAKSSRSRDHKFNCISLLYVNLIHSIYEMNARKIELKNPQRGKYFRIVSEVWIDGESVADMLNDE